MDCSKDNKIGALQFAFICNKEHSSALISKEKFERIKAILYGVICCLI
jgi:hypothetical protein